MTSTSLFILLNLFSFVYTVAVDCSNVIDDYQLNLRQQPHHFSSFVNSQPITKDVIRVMQYNLEWFFLDYYEPMDCPGDGCTWKNTSDARVHMNHLAKIIAATSPDILNLCEVQGCNELSELKNTLVNDYNMTGGIHYYLKEGTDTATGQNVALITNNGILPSSNLKRSDEMVDYPIPEIGRAHV